MPKTMESRKNTLSSESGTLISNDLDETPTRHGGSSFQHHRVQPRRWKSGDRIRHGINHKENPWKTCHRLTHRHDHNMVKAQTEEVQNLLIFASLFSAVVTSFAIDSYKFLQVDPEDTIPDLLGQIADLIAHNTSRPSSPSLPIVEQAFVRINIYWFVSLSLSLITVLLGTTCMQWLREYKHLGSVSFRDALHLRNLRYEGLVKWKVPFILSLLPILLQAALILFFAGIVELMWTLNVCVTVTIIASIGMAVVFMVVTAIAPAIQFLLNEGGKFPSHAAGPPCPYRSPQSWICLQAAIRCKFTMQRIKSCPCWNWDDKSGNQDHSTNAFAEVQSWFRYDLTWSRNQRMVQVHTQQINVDLLYGLKWMANTFAENMEAVQALYRCIRELDPITGLSACSVIRHGDLTMLDQCIQSSDISIYSGDEEIKASLLDQISATILEHFTTASPQFESALLPQRLELYARSRAENLRLDVAGLPHLRCPDLKAHASSLSDGNPSIDCDDADLGVQYLLYAERLVSHDAILPYRTLYTQDIDAGWEIIRVAMQRDPWAGEINPDLFRAMSNFFRTNKEYITINALHHVQESRQRFCIDKMLYILDVLHHFYDLLRKVSDMNDDARDLEEAITALVHSLYRSNSADLHLHPLFQMPSWLDIAVKSGASLPGLGRV